MSDHRSYIREHNLPRLVEGLLETCVPSRHPRPHEAMQQRLSFVRGFNHEADTAPPLQQPFVIGDTSITHAEVRSLEFDIFARAGDANNENGLDVVERVFTDPRQNLLVNFGIPVATFREWVRLVRWNYHAENPFHNFRHAVNVLQTLHSYVCSIHRAIANDDVPGGGGAPATSGGSTTMFTDVELFGAYIAALCHDLQHPGLNNAHLVSTEHPLAIRYNDRSVLENHHAAVAFALLDPANNGGIDILGSIRARGLKREFRAVVLGCILGTDVSKHKECIAAIRTDLTSVVGEDRSDGSLFRQIGASQATVLVGLNSLPAGTASAKRQLLLTALVEAADISNEVRHFRFSRMWAPLVAEEFWRQGDQEKKIGLEVAPMFDRRKVNLSRDQTGFIAYLCLPLYKALAEVLPATFGPRVRALEDNTAAWAAAEPL